MTRPTNAQYRKNFVAATVSDPNMMPIPAAEVVRQAQRDCARDLGRAIASGARWVGSQWTHYRRLAVDMTRSQTAA